MADTDQQRGAGAAPPAPLEQPAGHAEQLAQKDEQLAQQAEQLAQQAAQLAQAAAIIAQQAAGTMLRWPSCSLSTILGRDCRTARTRWTG